MKKTKSQVSVDFIIMLALVFIIFLFVLSTVSKRENELYAKAKTLSARSIADKLASNIDSAYLAGNGFNILLDLDDTLTDGTNYSIDLYPEHHFLEIRWDDKSYSSTLTTSSITGNLNSISSQVNITNMNNNIIIQ